MSNMIPPEADDLLHRLDQVIPPHSRAVRDDAGAENDPIVDAARRLAQGPDISLNHAALSRIEAQLRQRHKELHVARPAPTRRVWRPVFQVVRYAAAACLIVILALGGVSRASANSLPGDTLYSTKRTIEDVRLGLVSQGGEPSLRVNLADRRLDEFSLLLDRRDEVYPRVLGEATEQLEQALDLMSQGYGERVNLESRIASLTHRQSDLIQYAVTRASFNEWKQLQTAAQRNTALQVRLADEVLLPSFTPDTTPTPTPSPTFTLVPSLTPTVTPSPEATMTPIPTNTPRPSATATASPTITP
ncbi:MAG: hypothetical protein HY866_05095, partial [Chloroflexi bacterium]|nr:hypothetical protein [Chloroflexota bacterium]